MFNREVILAVKEMMERHWDVYQIAARMRMDPATIQAIIDFVNNVIT